MHQDDGYGSFGGLAYESIPLDETTALIQGVPYESATSGRKGSSATPSTLRLISKDMQAISRRGINLHDMILRDVGNIKINSVNGAITRKNIENAMISIMSNNDSPIISVGGDHSITYPLIKAIANTEKVGIIWFDAHRDLLDELDSSKYAHGCPLRRTIELNNVDPANVLLVGTRYITSEEQEFVEKNGINELTMVDLEDSTNKRSLFNDKLKNINSDVDQFYVSVDIDVLDPAYAPGTGTPVGGGMTTSDLMTFLWEIPFSVRAFDLVEISPTLDPSGITIKVGLGILTEILANIKKNK